ncbi:MAG TPA: DUF4197 domain-containing protein [Nitrospiraceae bacterium]|nr:DUF4197 domain-containing protein [Nitrospiraceae bacterium]
MSLKRQLLTHSSERKETGKVLTIRIKYRIRIPREMNAMRKITFLLFIASLIFASVASAGLLDKAKSYKDKVTSAREAPDTDTTVSGLKEALTVGSKNAVSFVSKTDGYFGNPEIRVPMPEKIEKHEKKLRKIGLGKDLDQFLLSMNRAAERAGPKAKDIFIDAVKAMTFQDARSIVKGGDTAATDYLRSKSFGKLAAEFRPIVASAMDEVGVTREYKKIMKRATATRIVREEDVDLDRHVTERALAGLFVMVGKEEKKIRSDPAARVTELLRQVFGK